MKTVKKKAVHIVRLPVRDEDGEIVMENGKPKFKDHKPGTIFDCPKDEVESLAAAGAITSPGRVSPVEAAAADPVEDDQDEDPGDDDDEPGDREALEARATELGIKFQKGWKDATLKKKIAEAEEADDDDDVM